MEYIQYIIIALLVIFLLQRVLPPKGVRQISISDLKGELVNKDKQFIDVRTPGEFKGNHIKAFKNIPLHQLSDKANKDLSKENEVIVICQSGIDRKSTRLNSSHVAISYAVFCLKKKRN